MSNISSSPKFVYFAARWHRYRLAKQKRPACLFFSESKDSVQTRIDRARAILNFDFCCHCTGTIRELVLLKVSYTSRLYGNALYSINSEIQYFRNQHLKSSHQMELLFCLRNRENHRSRISFAISTASIFVNYRVQ